MALVGSASDTSPDQNKLAYGWVLGPDDRGIGDILYSCLFTISLCVLTALHLNIPRIGSSLADRVKRKAKWVLIGIFAPEVVVYTALVQLFTVVRFRKELTKVIEQDLEEAKSTQRHSTRTQASGPSAPLSETSGAGADQAINPPLIRRAPTNIGLIKIDTATKVSLLHVQIGFG